MSYSNFNSFSGEVDESKYNLPSQATANWSSPTLRSRESLNYLGTKYKKNNYHKYSFADRPNEKTNKYCNNCGKQGHLYSQCKVPITSYGVIAFRYNPILKENEYLMVCRQNSFGFIDFMRGKYSIYNKHYICNMVAQMTVQEKNDLVTMEFDDLWRKLWKIHPPNNNLPSPPDTKNQNLPSQATVNWSSPTLRSGESLNSQTLYSNKFLNLPSQATENLSSRNINKFDGGAAETKDEFIGTKCKENVVACEGNMNISERNINKYKKNKKLVTFSDVRRFDEGFSGTKDEFIGTQSREIETFLDVRKPVEDEKYSEVKSKNINSLGGDEAETKNEFIETNCREFISSPERTVEKMTSKEKFNALRKGINIHLSSQNTTYILRSPSDYCESKQNFYSQNIGESLKNLQEQGVNKLTKSMFQPNVIQTFGNSPNWHSSTLFSQEHFIPLRSTSENSVSSTLQSDEKMNNSMFYSYSLYSIIDEYVLGEQWIEPEWGFPKGRRNYQEKDYDAAIREFKEETGYDPKYLKNIQNIFPFEENLVGSNYKCYKHKYYLMSIDYENSLRTEKYSNSEVSCIEWKTYQKCLDSIRSYNVE
jgi:8-oxo-dGTP pyrophosphatase MutT (NUDIX family)